MKDTRWNGIARWTSVRGSDGNGRSRWAKTAGPTQRTPITAELGPGVSSHMGLAIKIIAIPAIHATHASTTTRRTGRDKPPMIRPERLTSSLQRSRGTPTSSPPQARPTRAIPPQLIRSRPLIVTRRTRTHNTQARRHKLPALPICDMTRRRSSSDLGLSIHSSRDLLPILNNPIKCTSSCLHNALGPTRRNTRVICTDLRIHRYLSKPRGVGRTRTLRHSICRIGAISPSRR